MQQYTDIYLLQSYSTCFVCHSTHYQYISGYICMLFHLVGFLLTLVVCSCFDVCWSYGVARLKWYPCCSLMPATRIPPQPNHTETPRHIETRTQNRCGDTIEKSQAPDDGCTNVRNMLSIEEVK